MKSIELRLNGKSRQVDVRPDEPLLETIRQRCGVTSPKDGCAPQAQCGCCLVLMEGKALTSCAIPAGRADGKEIQTLEGIPAEDRRQLGAAFVASAGLQCGFCIPGFALRAFHLIGKNSSPTREEIAKAVDVHLCRCTGYTKILDAIESYAAAKRGEPVPTPCADGGVGERVARYSGEELTLGLRPFVCDLSPPGMLHAVVVQSPWARARIDRIDVTAAQSMDGVVAVATAADVTGERTYGLIERDWPGFIAEGEEARCVGDVLACVAAVDEATARAAAALIVIDAEELVPVTDPGRAIEPDAPQVNPNHDNVLSKTIVSRGDAARALGDCAHVVRGTWETQRIEHLFLEPESALAAPREDGRLHLWSQGQGVFDDRAQVASFLGVAEDDIFVELVPNGGAFGGKEDCSIQPHAALMAHLTGRPVKVTLNRDESINMHPKRHPIRMEYEVGCDADGRLTAVRARMLGDSGAYASVGAKVLERAAGHSCGPYSVPNVDVEAIAAYTNNPPCGAMRGFGANQAHFAMEGCMDRLAVKVGLDPWTIRDLNALDVGDTFTTGQVLEKSVGLKKTLAAVEPAYRAAVADGRAVGIACGIKNSGIGNGALEWGKARLVVEDDGTVSLYNGYTEMGQGLLTVLAQCASEASGAPTSIFRPKVDSTYALQCGQTTGSRATLFGGRAVKSAAEKLGAALRDGRTLADLAGEVFAADVLIDDTTKPGAKLEPGRSIKTHTAFGYATQVVVLDEAGRVEKVIAAHDVGRAINPALCEGQVEGSVHMGLGYALTEELPCVDGRPVTTKLRELGVLRARDMPEVEVILVEDPEPEGPWGAKGVGEIGLVPTAAAVASALEAFDGAARTTLPMKDSPAARAMSVGKIRATKKAGQAGQAGGA